MRTTVLKAALFTPLGGGAWGLPLLAWGEPGVAKTSIIEQVCAAYGLPCETLAPSERGEGAFGVVPVPDARGVLTYPRPDWTTRFDADGRGVVFVDEVTSCPPAIQPALMGLFLARRIGGWQLPGGVRVLGAANPPELATGGYELPHAVANRVGHIQWPAPTVSEHIAFLLGQATVGHGVSSASDEEARVLAAWGSSYAVAAGLEAAFLTRRPGLKNQCPKAGDPRGGGAWPSDRSWRHAVLALATSEVHDLSEADQEDLVAGFIGEATASELFAFAASQDLPAPEDVLDGVTPWKHDPKRLDRTVAVLSSCAAFVAPKTVDKRKERAAKFWELCLGLAQSKTDTDLLVAPVQTALSAGLLSGAAATKTLNELGPVLRAAGFNDAK